MAFSNEQFMAAANYLRDQIPLVKNAGLQALENIIEPTHRTST